MLRTLFLVAQLYCAATASLGGLPLLWCNDRGQLTLGCGCEHTEVDSSGVERSCCSAPAENGTGASAEACCTLTRVDLDPTEQPRQGQSPTSDLDPVIIPWTLELPAPRSATPPPLLVLTPTHPPSYLLYSGFLV
ncbi:MAG: hypothetical protein AB7O52_09045 [Planctomycetota bacterium]